MYTVHTYNYMVLAHPRKVWWGRKGVLIVLLVNKEKGVLAQDTSG